MSYNITIKQSHLRAFIIACTIVFIIIGFSIGCLYSDSKYQQRNDGLHNQLTRTQYQLKKSDKAKCGADCENCGINRKWGIGDERI